MYRATAEIVSGSKVFAGGKWLKCIGNKRVSVGERIWTDGRCVYGHFQEAQQPLVITGGDEAIPILAGKQCYIFYRGKLQLIGELDKYYSLMINDTRGNVFVYDDDTGARIDGNIREELKAANIDKAGNHYYLTQIYEIEDKDSKIVGDLRILKNGEVVKICSSPKKFADEVYDSVEAPSLDGIDPPKLPGDGSFPDPPWNSEMGGISFKDHFIENSECWSIFQDVNVVKTAENNGQRWKWNQVVEEQYIFCGEKTTLAYGRVWWDATRVSDWVVKPRHAPYLLSHYEPATYNSATIALQDGFYYHAKPAPKRPWYEGGVENQNFYKTFFSPKGNKIFELDGYARGKHLITRVAGGYLFKLDNSNSLSSLYLCKNNTLELIYQTKGGQAGKIKNQRLRPMKRYKNWHKRIREINLNQTA